MMTNATIIENNSTSNDQINGEKCNQTTNADNDAQNCVVNTLQTPNSHCSNNNTVNNSTNAIDCENTITNDDNRAINIKNNQVVDENTVLKYVYKKGDPAEIPTKDKGHFKNSLKRRKRSTNELHNKSPLPSKFQKPVIVNYETSHAPREDETLLPVRKTENTISGANLAAFSIETLHDNANIKNKANVAPNLKKDSSEVENLNEASNESNERDDNQQKDDTRKSSRESDESDEHGDYKSKKSHLDNENSGEHEDYRNRNPSRREENSAEGEDYKNIKSNNEGDVSGEREHYRNRKYNRGNDDSAEHEDYKNRQSSREGDNSGEREDYRNRKSSREKDDSDERSAYKDKSSHERGDSGKREIYKDIESSRERDNSGERVDYKNNRNSTADTYNSDESAESSPRTNSKYSSPTGQESSESYKNRKSYPNSAESQESIEIHEVKKPHDGSQQIRKGVGYSQDSKSHGALHLDNLELNKVETNPRKNFESSIESSDESDDEKRKSHDKQKNYKTNPKNHINKNSAVPIQDIDLNDFSYERIHINDNGKVGPQKDNLEEVDPNTAVEILSLSTATPDSETKNHEPLNSLTDDNSLPISENGSYDSKLVNINDGEVKPVVEIHSENDSGSSEENTKPNLSDEVESLESILGVKEPEFLEDNGQSDKIVAQKKVQNGDVKQQFERIPVNYNHNEKNLNKDSETTETPKEEDTGVTKSDGTLDVFAPDDVRYDEHLNIKFDDLTIKLPEIKLPDDILAYTRESSPFDDENKNKLPQDVPSYEPSYYYNHDDREKTRERKNKKDEKDENDADDDDDDHRPDTGYNGYYGDSKKNQNYEKENSEAESDEEEDLYEKFVRERFGKRGTFGKRSEKLQAGPLNPELFKTVKNILKKTADIDEQAKKSGDPNAGYMWTLEYDEKL